MRTTRRAGAAAGFSRRLAWLAVASLGALALLGGAAPPASGALALLGGAAPALARGPGAASAIASLGDSFISGEGGRWLGNAPTLGGDRFGSDRAAHACGAWGCAYDPERVYGASEASGCHRSDVAPVRSAPLAIAVRLNFACSGARLVNLWPSGWGGEPHFGQPPQAEALGEAARRYRLRMVVVTAGANDVGFGSLVVECALDWARSEEAAPRLCRDDAAAEIGAALPRARRGLVRALRGVRRALAGAGQPRDGYRLVAMGYTSPFPPGRLIRYPEAGWSRLREGGCPLWNADADWAAAGVAGALARIAREAAAVAGAEFLDLRHALDGHQLCDRRARLVGPEGPSPLTAEWVRRLAFVQGSSRESLHPNAYGQQAIGACLGLLYAAPRGDYACRATPGRFLDGIRIEALG